MTLVEPGGARTSFVGSSLRLGRPLAAYDGTPAAAVRAFKDTAVPVPGDPPRSRRRSSPARPNAPPLRLVLGSDSYQASTAALRPPRQVEPQRAGAAETDADA
ncbi:hypothetical protein NKH77_41340 [Streptomyces sp. M19]